MVNKKIKIKNNASTLTGVVITILMVLGIFFACFLFIEDNIDSSGQVLDSKYNDSYEKLLDSETELKADVNQIKEDVNNIKEAESTFQVAWNGLKGLGNTLKLPINFIDIGIGVWDSTTASLDFLPGWVLPLAFTAILVSILFLVLAILKGEPKL